MTELEYFISENGQNPLDTEESSASNKTTRLFLVELYRLLRNNKNVYLPRLGFLHPKDQEVWKLHQVESETFLRREVHRTIEFEKSDDSSNSAFDSFVEINAIAESIYPKLSIFEQTKTSAREIKQTIQNLIKSFREKVIFDGLSSLLDILSPFIALHNRQGLTAHDWFAGSDIFLADPPTWLVRVKEVRPIILPTVATAWELVAAIYEQPPTTTKLLMLEQATTVSLSVFKAPHPDKPEQVLLTYCTDGLRGYQWPEKSSTNFEFVFQLLVSNTEAELPEWPTELIVQAIQNWDGQTSFLNFPDSITINLDIELRSLLITNYDPLPHLYQTPDIPFRLKCLVGITNDEFEFGVRRSPKLLQAILKRRGLSQTTRTTRGSVFGKSSMIVPYNKIDVE